MRVLEYVNSMAYSSSSSIDSNLDIVIFMVFGFSDVINFFNV